MRSADLALVGLEKWPVRFAKNALASEALVKNALVSEALVKNALVTNALVSNALVQNCPCEARAAFGTQF